MNSENVRWENYQNELIVSSTEFSHHVILTDDGTIKGTGQRNYLKNKKMMVKSLLVLFVVCVAISDVVGGRWYGGGRWGKRGKNGCLKLNSFLGCPRPNCPTACEFGYARNTTSGCIICDCQTDPCIGVTCPDNSVCTSLSQNNFAYCIPSYLFDKVKTYLAGRYTPVAITTPRPYSGGSWWSRG
ncbi:hypothetical protein SNEBB_004988 [Seison nebaliae]|nr:hypothetical protein SNEBB_004988 [Seison nebaliae]